jgi:transcription factor MYB, plant
MRRQVPCLDEVPLEGSSSGVHPCSAATPFMETRSVSAALAPYDWAGSGPFSFDDGALPLACNSHACSSSNAAALLPFDQPPYPLLDVQVQGVPAGWNWNMAPGFANAGATDHLAYQELLPLTQAAPMVLPFFDAEYPLGGVKAELPDAAPDNFDDLPPDVFDSFDQPPPPVSPPATSSGF